MGRKILEVKNVTKTNPGVVALDNVSFDVEEGEILALIGENGAGKSTVIKTISGAIQADSGEIIIDGQRFTKLNPTQAKEAGIGVVYQELNLVPSLSIMENIFLGDHVGGGRLGPNFREMRKRSEAQMRNLDAIQKNMLDATELRMRIQDTKNAIRAKEKELLAVEGGMTTDLASMAAKLAVRHHLSVVYASPVTAGLFSRFSWLSPVRP